jgi:TonB family protein
MNLELRTPALVLSLMVTAASLPAVAQTRNDSTVFNEDMKIIHFEDFDYPEAARRAGVEGVVVVAATLDNKGRISNAAAVSGPRLLVADTLANARKWQFQPNRLNRVVIVYRFMLVDDCAPDTLQSLFTWNGPGPNEASVTACRASS